MVGGPYEQAFSPTSPFLPAPATIDTSYSLAGITCPTAAECIAVDSGGRALEGDPAASAWAANQIAGANALNDIACNSTSPCVAVDSSGNFTVGYSPPIDSAAPAISGAAAEGQTLTAAHGTWLGNPTSLAFQWADCDTTGNSCVNIARATDQSYTIAAADVTHTIRVFDTATNAHRQSTTASSAATSAVRAPAIAPSSTASLHISGTAIVGRTLTAIGGFAGTQPLTYTSEWQLCAQACATIAATGSTYVVRTRDLGARLRVIVTAANVAGEATATSLQVGPVLDSIADIKARLLAALTPHGKPAKIASILKTGGVLAAFFAPEAGRVTLAWYLVPGRAGLTRAKPVLEATGSASTSRLGPVSVLIRLTGAGRRLLRLKHQPSLSAKGTFRPSRLQPISALKSLKLQR